MKKIFQIILLSLCLPLAGCFSSEPSESEIFQAAETYLNNASNAHPLLSAPLFKVRILRLQKLSCSKAGSNEYICLVEVTISTELTGTATVRERYQMLKLGRRWEFMGAL